MSYHMKYQVYGGMLRPADTWVPRSRRGAMARRRGSTSRACNIAAHAPDHGKHGGQFLRRKAFQQALLAATHHDVERVEERAALVGQIDLDVAGVGATQYA